MDAAVRAECAPVGQRNRFDSTAILSVFEWGKLHLDLVAEADRALCPTAAPAHLTGRGAFERVKRRIPPSVCHGYPQPNVGVGPFQIVYRPRDLHSLVEIEHRIRMMSSEGAGYGQHQRAN